MKLVDQLKKDFSQFLFVPDEICHWSPSENTIFYLENDSIKMLHELGHAICGHNNFVQDIELIHAERDAWGKACEIATKYDIKISKEAIEKAMDSYRDWLHHRGTCPECGQTGIQRRSDRHYQCLNCNTVWNVNDGRNTRLHRYIQK
jgi:hypothetical protein